MASVAMLHIKCTWPGPYGPAMPNFVAALTRRAGLARAVGRQERHRAAIIGAESLRAGFDRIRACRACTGLLDVFDFTVIGGGLSGGGAIGRRRSIAWSGGITGRRRRHDRSAAIFRRDRDPRTIGPLGIAAIVVPVVAVGAGLALRGDGCTRGAADDRAGHCAAAPADGPAEQAARDAAQNAARDRILRGRLMKRHGAGKRQHGSCGEGAKHGLSLSRKPCRRQLKAIGSHFASILWRPTLRRFAGKAHENNRRGNVIYERVLGRDTKRKPNGRLLMSTAPSPAAAPIRGPILPILAKYWWLVLLRGIVAILFGILAFAWPGITLVTMVLFWGAFMLVDGVLALGQAVMGDDKSSRWWLALIGIAGIVAGILVFAQPGAAIVVLLLFIAAWSIVLGVFQIIGAIRLRKEIDNEWTLILGGVLSVLFGAVLVIAPLAGILALVWVIGSYAIVFGILLVMAALKLKQHQHA